jgi:FSR family fosmidomycin resistance protein-like MFS transporter
MVLIVLSVMFLSWFQFSFRTYLPAWVEQQGGTVQAGGQMMFVFSMGLGVGTLLGGALSDRVGRWQLLAICLVLLGPATWFYLSASGATEVALVALLGMLVGATFPVNIVMAQETWPRSVGIASGLVMGLGWVPGGLGASLTGLLADRISLLAALRTLVIPAALSAVCVLAYATLQRSPAPKASVSPAES